MYDGSWWLVDEQEVHHLAAAAGEALFEPDELSVGTSLSSLPPPKLQDELDWPGSHCMPSWPRQARLCAAAWWQQSARYALLALGRAGLPRESLARELWALLVPDESSLEDPRTRVAACPFPDADVVEALWDQLCDMYHARSFLYDFGTVLWRITEQVLTLPHLACWVRRGRASQVVGFLLSSQCEFLQRPSPRSPPRWPWAEEHSVQEEEPLDGCLSDDCSHEAVKALYERWFATRAPAAITANRLLTGELCLEALASEGDGGHPEGSLPQLVREEVMMTEGGAEAGEVTCRQEMEALRRSWLYFRAMEAERAARRRSVLQARAAARLEREQRQRARRLQRAASLQKLGRLCTRWVGRREWRRRQ